MDVVTTSLEALIQRVTNPQNQKPDVAAIEAFCAMLNKESEGIQIGTKLLALHIQSSNEPEALQALTLLDMCMRRCGPTFHAEIGKFRFLNEMIRLVSPKYLGARTPMAVQQKVLQLLQAWTQDYPRELKIKEAYKMLKKQGVIDIVSIKDTVGCELDRTTVPTQEDSPSIIPSAENGFKTIRGKSTIFEDEAKSKLLQKLLRSKNPDDLQAANSLIKTMVREDERRVQLNSRRLMELESIHNNAKLLSEMLDSYNRNETTAEDLELMKELHQACDRLKPIIVRMATETYGNEGMLGEVLATGDELDQVFEKYSATIIRGESSVNVPRTDLSVTPSLLDLSSPVEDIPCESALDDMYNVPRAPTNVTTTTATTAAMTAMTAITATTTMISTTSTTAPTIPQSNVEVLRDIFGSIEKSMDTFSVSSTNVLIPDSIIMQPTSILSIKKKGEIVEPPEKKMDSKSRALEELNELGESLLKQSLSSKMIHTQSNLPGSKLLPVKSTLKIPPVGDIYVSTANSGPFGDLGVTNGKVNKDRPGTFNQFKLECSNLPKPTSETTNDHRANLNSPTLGNNLHPELKDSEKVVVNPQPEIKPLTDINVTLQDITPGTIAPITVIEEKNGISVVLNFARDNPRPDVFILVITTVSKNAKPLSNYLFQAVVPKKCKCRLQTPSGTELPAHNPFLPPSAITQIMLVANPSKESVSLKFMLSYTMDDETFTEMAEVEKLPHP